MGRISIFLMIRNPDLMSTHYHVSSAMSKCQRHCNVTSAAPTVKQRAKTLFHPVGKEGGYASMWGTLEEKNPKIVN